MTQKVINWLVDTLFQTQGEADFLDITWHKVPDWQLTPISGPLGRVQAQKVEQVNFGYQNTHGYLLTILVMIAVPQQHFNSEERWIHTVEERIIDLIIGDPQPTTIDDVTVQNFRFISSEYLPPVINEVMIDMVGMTIQCEYHRVVT